MVFMGVFWLRLVRNFFINWIGLSFWNGGKMTRGHPMGLSDAPVVWGGQCDGVIRMR